MSSYQAVLLLRKFVRCDIIKRVDVKDDEEYEFHDNRDLYCFTRYINENLPVQPPPEDDLQSVVSSHTSRSTLPSASSLSSIRPLSFRPVLSEGALRETTNNYATSYRAAAARPTGIAIEDERVAVFVPKGDYAPVTVFNMPVRTSPTAFTAYI